ncbi:hypothetical protein DOY81_006069 [Sarcophaga bullata]|nr:hypothetical protein DOY81_006069 [Sarcophaga bullata]
MMAATTVPAAAPNPPVQTSERRCENPDCNVNKLIAMVPKRKISQFVSDPLVCDKPMLVNGFTAVFQVDGSAAKLLDIKNPAGIESQSKPIYRIIPNSHVHVVNYVVVDTDETYLKKITENDPATMQKLLTSQKESADQMLKKIMSGQGSSATAAMTTVVSTINQNNSTMLPTQTTSTSTPNHIQKTTAPPEPQIPQSLAPLVHTTATQKTAIKLPVRMHPNLKITAVASAEGVSSATNMPPNATSTATGTAYITPVPLTTLQQQNVATTSHSSLNHPTQTNIDTVDKPTYDKMQAEINDLRRTVAMLAEAQAKNQQHTAPVGPSRPAKRPRSIREAPQRFILQSPYGIHGPGAQYRESPYTRIPPVQDYHRVAAALAAAAPLPGSAGVVQGPPPPSSVSISTAHGLETLHFAHPPATHQTVSTGSTQLLSNAPNSTTGANTGGGLPGTSSPHSVNNASSPMAGVGGGSSSSGIIGGGKRILMQPSHRQQQQPQQYSNEYLTNAVSVAAASLSRHGPTQGPSDPGGQQPYKNSAAKANSSSLPSSAITSITSSSVSTTTAPAATSSIAQSSSSSTEAYHPQVEAISPTLPADNAEERGPTAKEELLMQIQKVDTDITGTDSTLVSLRKKERSLLDVAAAAKQQKEQAEAARLKAEADAEDDAANSWRSKTLAQKIYMANRKTAASQHSILDSCGQRYLLPLYNQPLDVEHLTTILQRHQATIKGHLLEHIRKIKHDRWLHHTKLVETYAQMSAEWQKRVDKSEASAKRRAREAKNREFFEKVFTELRKQREDKERFNRVGSRIKSEADYEEIMDGLHEQAMEVRKMRSYAIIPPLMYDAHQRTYAYHNENGLIEDMVAVHKERAKLNVWTTGEKDTFKEKFLQHPKNFGAIAASLDRKSAQDCVRYYYLSKKTENYKQLLRKSRQRTRASKTLQKSQQQQTQCIIDSLTTGVTTRLQREQQQKTGGRSAAAERERERAEREKAAEKAANEATKTSNSKSSKADTATAEAAVYTTADTTTTDSTKVSTHSGNSKPTTTSSTTTASSSIATASTTATTTTASKTASEITTTTDAASTGTAAKTKAGETVGKLDESKVDESKEVNKKKSNDSNNSITTTSDKNSGKLDGLAACSSSSSTFMKEEDPLAIPTTSITTTTATTTTALLSSSSASTVVTTNATTTHPPLTTTPNGIKSSYAAAIAAASTTSHATTTAVADNVKSPANNTSMAQVESLMGANNNNNTDCNSDVSDPKKKRVADMDNSNLTKPNSSTNSTSSLTITTNSNTNISNQQQQQQQQQPPNNSNNLTKTATTTVTTNNMSSTSSLNSNPAHISSNNNNATADAIASVAGGMVSTGSGNLLTTSTTAVTSLSAKPNSVSSVHVTVSTITSTCSQSSATTNTSAITTAATTTTPSTAGDLNAIDGKVKGKGPHQNPSILICSASLLSFASIDYDFDNSNSVVVSILNIYFRALIKT